MRRPGGRTAQTSEKIFDAVFDLLIQGGYEAVTFQAVADRAKVGRATIYRRWTDPGSLVAEAVRARAAEQIVVLDMGSLRSDLKIVLGQIVRFTTSPIGRAALLASFSDQTRDSDALSDEARWVTRWRDIEPIFARAKARGELLEGADSEVLFAGLAGAIYFRLFVISSPPDESWIERILDHGITREGLRRDERIDRQHFR
jgi:AcrR family transcriptional regulator